MGHAPYTFFGSLFHVGHGELHVVTAIFLAVLLVGASAWAYRRLKETSKAVIPDRKFGLTALFEMAIDFLVGMADDIIGHGSRKYLPFLGTVFLFILSCNLIGLIPGFLPPTENWATGAAIAVIVFLTYNFFGFREHGVLYLKHFTAPLGAGGKKNPIVWVILLAMVLLFQGGFALIELISSLIRPVTLSIRLYVNIMADHLVASIFAGIVPYLLPLPFLVLGLLVAFLQALVFTLLTTVYISLAVAHEH